MFKDQSIFVNHIPTHTHSWFLPQIEREYAIEGLAFAYLSIAMAVLFAEFGVEPGEMRLPNTSRKHARAHKCAP